MTDIKLSLTVAVPGATMVSEEASSGNAVKFQVYNERSKRMENIFFRMNKRIPAQQVINMTTEAYENFISEAKPWNYKGTSVHWKHMKRKERLIWHLENIAEELGGEIISYHVFND